MTARVDPACVSLEITQRCNLDCTLCYLSDAAQAVRDFPLDEVLRRIDLILQHYGPGTDVQVSGGEPTLRRRDELVAIVRRLSSLGLRASLLTNGIKATRELLTELCEAGLTDVAFHVDTTQQRADYASESELNAQRRELTAGLLLITPWDRLAHVGAHHYPWLPVKWMLRDDYDTQARLAGFDRPVLVAVAERDSIVPARFGRALHAGLVAPKRLVVFEGADHNDWTDRVDAGWWRASVAFALDAELP